jgi:RNA polymerase sigma-70 factor (ECF subfamily)
MLAAPLHSAPARRTDLAAAGRVSLPRARVAELHRRFDAPLRRFFARHRARPDEIDDLAQEVFLRLIRLSDADADCIANPQAFVFATATNLLRDRFRRRSVRGVELSVENDAPALEDEKSDPVAAVAAGQQLRAVVRALGTLKPTTRWAFLRHRLLGRSHADIARELGVSISMVEKHMICAIAALRPLR